MNNVLEFINEYLHNIIGDDGEVTIDYNANEDCITLVYNKYPEIPPSIKSISEIEFMQMTNSVEEIVKFIHGNLITLITYYKMSPEYMQSKYYKYDIIKQRMIELEEDFK